eukprot:c28972_g1_i1 orf=202-558(+)
MSSFTLTLCLLRAESLLLTLCVLRAESLLCNREGTNISRNSQGNQLSFSAAITDVFLYTAFFLYSFLQRQRKNPKRLWRRRKGEARRHLLVEEQAVLLVLGFKECIHNLSAGCYRLAS